MHAHAWARPQWVPAAAACGQCGPMHICLVPPRKHKKRPTSLYTNFVPQCTCKGSRRTARKPTKKRMRYTSALRSATYGPQSWPIPAILQRNRWSVARERHGGPGDLRGSRPELYWLVVDREDISICGPSMSTCVSCVQGWPWGTCGAAAPSPKNLGARYRYVLYRPAIHCKKKMCFFNGLVV
jgi:hypothetical protein